MVPSLMGNPVQESPPDRALWVHCGGCWGRLTTQTCVVGVPIQLVKMDPTREAIGFATTTSNPVIIAPTNATLDPTGFVVSQGPIVWLKPSEAGQFVQWEWWGNCLGPAQGFITVYELLKPNW